MDLLRDVRTAALRLVPTAVVLAAVVIVLFLVNRLLERTKRLAEGGRFRNQFIMIGLTFVGAWSWSLSCRSATRCGASCSA